MAYTAPHMTSEICQTLRSQIGLSFECDIAGERIQIRTPFMFPDGHQIDLYWRNTASGQVVSDLGETSGWLFMHGGDDTSASRQDRVYAAACETYGVERLDIAMLVRVSEGDLADAVIRLAQAITAISQSLDSEELSDEVVPESDRGVDGIVDSPANVISVSALGYGWSGRAFSEPVPKKLTANRIEDALSTPELRYERNVKLVGRTKNAWKLDYFVHTAETDAALMALHGRTYLGWQRRAVTHVYSMFTDSLPVLRESSRPVKAISVIDDNDYDWYEEPIQLLSTVSEVVRLSKPDNLVVAIFRETH